MKHLFLKWCVTNVIATASMAAIFTLISSQVQHLSGIATAIVGVIGVVYLIGMAQALRICWRFEYDMVEKAKDRMKHDVKDVAFAATICPYIGIFGSVGGIFVSMDEKLSGLSGADQIKETVMSSMTGIGIAFVPTMAGLFACIVLLWMDHLIHRSVGRPTA